jgi:hypothetical protein
MNTDVWLKELTDARLALRLGKPKQSAVHAGSLLEDLLHYLINSNLDRLEAHIGPEIRMRYQNVTGRQRRIDFRSLERIYHDLRVLDALQHITGRSTSLLKTLRIGTCREIRNRAAHIGESPVSADEARYLLSTAEQFLAYLNVDVESTWGGDAEAIPLKFSDVGECLHVLLRRIWEFPDAGGTRSSWAVKESDILKGDLTRAIERPGIGTALFTTELASEVFGSEALPKIRASANWGLNRTTPSAPHLLTDSVEDRITGQVKTKLDFRHTIALASLMSRSGDHFEYQKHYLELLLTHACPDGGWPASLEFRESDLTATVYAVEYLGVCLKSAPASPQKIETALRQGQEWLVLASLENGGWASGIFSDTQWDHLWSTALILQRLLLAVLPPFTEWSQSLQDAAAMLLRDLSAVNYQSPLLQLRVEARIASALTIALQLNLMPALSKERAEAWLQQWEQHFQYVLRDLPACECDLATSTFAARVLLRGKNYRNVGRHMLAKYK